MSDALMTTTNSWWPFLIVAGGGLAWTLLCIAVAHRFECHDGPVSFAVIPVLAGVLVLVAVVETYW